MPYVKQAAFEFLLNAAQNVYPREFIGLLRGEKDVITEVLVLPQSMYGEGFSSVSHASIPIDHSIIGSVHSHPSHSYNPSSQDLVFFRKSGDFHLILRYPYGGLEDIACYTSVGEPVDLWLVD